VTGSGVRRAGHVLARPAGLAARSVATAVCALCGGSTVWAAALSAAVAQRESFLSAPAAASAPRSASSAPVAIRCTNPYSRTSWTITVNYTHRTVDEFPAKISRTEIRWDDTVHGGHYSLNRMTGDLTVLFASSTGGYALHDVCDLRSSVASSTTR
jgi:hypothetical protein